MVQRTATQRQRRLTFQGFLAPLCSQLGQTITLFYRTTSVLPHELPLQLRSLFSFYFPVLCAIISYIISYAPQSPNLIITVGYFVVSYYFPPKLQDFLSKIFPEVFALHIHTVRLQPDVCMNKSVRRCAIGASFESAVVVTGKRCSPQQIWSEIVLTSRSLTDQLKPGMSRTRKLTIATGYVHYSLKHFSFYSATPVLMYCHHIVSPCCMYV